MSKFNNTVDLTELLNDAAQRAQRPRMVPREVAAQALQNCLGGVGVGCAVWATMAYFGIGTGMETGLFVAVLFAGIVMGVRSVADEAVDMYRLNRIKRAADEHRKRLRLAIVELNNLERQNDQLQRDLDTERIIRAQLQERLQNRPTNYVKPKAEPEPQEVRDGREIIERWYTQNVYISRQKATDMGWTQGRHRAAVALLTDASVIGPNGQQMVFLTRSIDEAQQKLSDHLVRIKAQTEPLNVAEQEDYDN